jgi:hypothetical protein
MNQALGHHFLIVIVDLPAVHDGLHGWHEVRKEGRYRNNLTTSFCMLPDWFNLK